MCTCICGIEDDTRIYCYTVRELKYKSENKNKHSRYYVKKNEWTFKEIKVSKIN